MMRNSKSITNSAPLAIAAYCISSILMTLTNKFILSTFHFNMVFLLLAIQSTTCVVLLGVFRSAGLVEHRSFHSEDAKRWSIVSFALVRPFSVLLVDNKVAMIYTGSKAIQHLSIPLFTIFKNLTIILIAYGETTYFNGSKVTRMMLVAFFMMVLSSVVGGWTDLATGDLFKQGGVLVAYTWMTLNCLSTASYALLVKQKIKETGFKDFDTVYYSNLLSIPILLTLSFITEMGEASNLFRVYFSAHKFVDESNSNLYALLATICVSGISGFAISYGSSWCVRVTSSTTYSMVGALNKLPIAVAGMVLFENAYSPNAAMGVFIAFCAGLLYSRAKDEQKKEEMQYIPLFVNREEISILDADDNGIIKGQ